MKIKRIQLILLFIGTISLLLTGCWDKLEIEEQAYVIVIGIDKGTNDDLEVTYQVANPQGGGLSGQGAAEKEPASEIVTFFVPDIISARDTASTTITRRPAFSHVIAMVIGEEMARSDDFFPLLDAAIRDPQLRQNTFFIISKEKAADFIRNNSPNLETRPHKYYQFMKKRTFETGMVGISTLHRFLQRTESDQSLFLATYGTAEELKSNKEADEDEYMPGEVDKYGGNVTELVGTVVLKEGKMIGALNGEQTRQALLLRPHSRFDSMLVTYPDPIKKDKRITTRLIKRRDTEITMDLNKNPPTIDVTVPLKMDILYIPSGINYVQNTENQQLLEDSIEKDLNTRIKDIIKQTQKEFKGEPFMWSLIARKQFLTLDQYKEFDWMKVYPKAKVSVKFDISVRNTGKQLPPPNFEIIKD